MADTAADCVRLQPTPGNMMPADSCIYAAAIVMETGRSCLLCWLWLHHSILHRHSRMLTVWVAWSAAHIRCVRQPGQSQRRCVKQPGHSHRKMDLT